MAHVRCWLCHSSAGMVEAAAGTAALTAASSLSNTDALLVAYLCSGARHWPAAMAAEVAAFAAGFTSGTAGGLAAPGLAGCAAAESEAGGFKTTCRFG